MVDFLYMSAVVIGGSIVAVGWMFITFMMSLQLMPYLIWP